MNRQVRVKKAIKQISAEELKNMSKEELIEKVKALQAHNIQLQNILQKSTPNPLARDNNFDFSKCRFRHVLLHFFYLGWDYQGFASQEETTNTIEYHLFEALTKTCLIKDRQSSNYHRCGRTDKGVSSFGQVVSIDLRSKLNEENDSELDKEIDYCKVLNRVLPNDIQCIAWAPVDGAFSARFDCLSRTYKYYFPKGDLSIDKMLEASQYLIGSHDFRNLAKMDVGNGVVQFVRNILDFRIEPVDPRVDNEYSMYVAIIKGNAFLWHQIRYIMAVLFLVGSGKEDPCIIRELLDVEKYPRKPEYNMASEQPLNLFYCDYKMDIQWQRSEENLRSVVEKLQCSWTISNIKTTMIKNVLEELQTQLNNSGSLESLSSCLISGVKHKSYIPLLKRQTCDSLEDKIKHYTKRKRIELTSDPQVMVEPFSLKN